MMALPGCSVFISGILPLIIIILGKRLIHFLLVRKGLSLCDTESLHSRLGWTLVITLYM